MSEQPDRAAMQEAGEVLQRLAVQVEVGTLAADDEAAGLIAAAWRGASEALTQAVRRSGPRSGSA